MTEEKTESKFSLKRPREYYEGVRETVLSFLPPEFVEHLENSRREQLLAVRALIDGAIDRIDRGLSRLEEKKGT